MHYLTTNYSIFLLQATSHLFNIFYNIIHYGTTYNNVGIKYEYLQKMLIMSNAYQFSLNSRFIFYLFDSSVISNLQKK